MNKIKTIKVLLEDGTVDPNLYIIATDADNVDMTNGHNVQENIGNINIEEDGNIAQQLAEIIRRLNALEANN